MRSYALAAEAALSGLPSPSATDSLVAMLSHMFADEAPYGRFARRPWTLSTDTKCTNRFEITTESPRQKHINKILPHHSRLNRHPEPSSPFEYLHRRNMGDLRRCRRLVAELGRRFQSSEASICIS